MASVGHLAVGLAAARFQAGGAAPRLPALAVWPALSLLPDLDVVGLAIAFHPDACAAAGLNRGSRRADVEQRLGPPREACWQYSHGGEGALRGRVICFSSQGVRAVWRGRR